MSTKGRVQGEVAVVTGGSLGIGKAFAEMLAREGASVAVTDLLANEGNKACQRYPNDGRHCTLLAP